MSDAGDLGADYKAGDCGWRKVGEVVVLWDQISSDVVVAIWLIAYKIQLNDKRTISIRNFNKDLLTYDRVDVSMRQFSLDSDSNFLERCKLSMGFSKAAFKVEKFKTRMEDTRHVHGVEYGFGALDHETTGIYEVEPKQCPGFTFRKSILFGRTDLGPKEVHSLMEKLSKVYLGNTYHLKSKNCNHF